MRVVLFGGSGQAGTELMRIASTAGFEIHAPARQDLDVRDTDRLTATIIAHRPSWIVNFTAFHVLEACEHDFAAALAINAVAVRNMARAAEQVNARFLTVSTDYVFDGYQQQPYLENDAPRPIQAYGISKLAGELAARAVAPAQTYVVRTCGLYGRNPSRERAGNFVEKRLADAKSNSILQIGCDLRCTPTSARAFSMAVLKLMQTEVAEPGIYHLTAEGCCSWAEFTAEILRLSGSSCCVEPIDRKGNYGIVRRPPYSVMANRRAASFGIKLPSWEADLADYFGSWH